MTNIKSIGGTFRPALLVLLLASSACRSVSAFSPGGATRRRPAATFRTPPSSADATSSLSSSSSGIGSSNTALFASKKKGKTKKGGGGGGGGGFGAKSKAAVANVEQHDNDEIAFAPVRNKGPSYDFTSHVPGGNSIESYLNPRFFDDPATLNDVRSRLRRGEVVILRDAFTPDFADAMHRELLATAAWTRNENYLDDGYHYRHYNVYDKSAYSKFFNDTLDMLSSDATKAFMTELSGRDCTGEITGSPSYYGGGDHSLPHTDHFGQRTVAYVWHLSKNWRPEWGGGLYWAPEPLANAYHHASYNTLVLFSVTPHSSHFVTTVSPHATEKRLSFNGWWQSSWTPALEGNSAADHTTDASSEGEGGGVPLENMIDTPEKRMRLTYHQYVTIDNLLHDPWSPRVEPPERRERLEGLMREHMAESYPPSRSPPI